MTEIKAKVVEFDLLIHPDADLLSVAIIKGTGWQCVVKTTDLENKSLGVYISIDSEVPANRSEFASLAHKAKKDGKIRIKTVRIRQALSQGLLIPAPDGAKLGDDLTEVLGVTRWEPAIPAILSGNMIREPGNFQKYTSIENYKNFPNVFVENDAVRCTEKLHGSSVRYGFINDGSLGDLKYFVGSHKTSRDKDGNNLYSKMSQKFKIEEKLFPFIEKYKPNINLIVYAEVIGNGVQDLTYGCEIGEQQLRIFDVLIDHAYQPWSVIQEISDALDISTVPMLYRGPFTLQKALELRDGKTTLGAEHVREGIVVTAEPEMFHRDIGRKIVKYISDDYYFRKNQTDCH